MIAEIFLRQREEKGREKGRKEALQQFAARFEGMTTKEERLAEIDRFIQETLNDKGQWRA